MMVNHIAYLALLVIGIALWSLTQLILGGLYRLYTVKTNEIP